jgi:hypothetical protein
MQKALTRFRKTVSSEGLFAAPEVSDFKAPFLFTEPHSLHKMKEDDDVEDKGGEEEGEDEEKGKKSAGPKKRFEVKKWNAVALWAWGTMLQNIAT